MKLYFLQQLVRIALSVNAVQGLTFKSETHVDVIAANRTLTPKQYAVADTLAAEWAKEVRAAMIHTWSNYKAHAWGHDSVAPVSGTKSDWCGMAITMLEGLSTLSLMNMTTEVHAVADWLQSKHLPRPGKYGFQSLFEINIRALGGLLSAYSLNRNQVFLDTAHRLGDHLINAFGTSSGIPEPTVDVATGEGAFGGTSLAEVGTFQMEFPYLSHVTGDRKFTLASDRDRAAIWRASGGSALVPTSLDEMDEISFGGQGDSYYEYLLKSWLLTGKKNDELKRKWIDSANQMVKTMVKTSGHGRVYIGTLQYGKVTKSMEHLTCFVPGMLMLGSRTLPKKDVNPLWEVVAHGLADTCYHFSQLMPTGLAPEKVHFSDDPNVDMMVENEKSNVLRPEIAESIYYMWFFTGDPKYRVWSHNMFSAFQKYSKSEFGYSSVEDVQRVPPKQTDSQESFWLAETLKYFYLTFAPRNTLDLNKWVLTTEGHPLPMYEEM